MIWLFAYLLTSIVCWFIIEYNDTSWYDHGLHIVFGTVFSPFGILAILFIGLIRWYQGRKIWKKGKCWDNFVNRHKEYYRARQKRKLERYENLKQKISEMEQY